MNPVGMGNKAQRVASFLIQNIHLRSMTHINSVGGYSDVVPSAGTLNLECLNHFKTAVYLGYRIETQ